jgi:uncharacterized coiled-coil DUF342 family protein
MADFERCYCGAMSHTPDGLCHRHATELARLRPKPPEPTLEEKLAECQAARHHLNEDLMKMRDERDYLKRKLRDLRKQVTLVRIGDMTIEEVEL